MTRHELLVVTIRLFAIALVLYTIRGFPTSLDALSVGPETPVTSTLVVTVHLALLLVAVALWKFPAGVAALILPTSGAGTPGISWSQESVVETASIVIGLFYLAYAVSDLIYWFSFCVAWSKLEPGTFHLDASQWAGIITTIFEVVIALYLILGSRGVARLVRITRYGGRTSSN